MNKICERCNKEFNCGGTLMSTQKCWCFDLPKIQLPENKYTDCLCKDCLMQLQDTTTDQLKKNLTAGSDFYYENGLMVLTEAYLKKRGFCCGNKCRHCPY